MIHIFQTWQKNIPPFVLTFTFACFSWWGKWLRPSSSDMTLTVPSSGKLGTWRQHLWAAYPPFPAAKLLVKRWLKNPVLVFHHHAFTSCVASLRMWQNSYKCHWKQHGAPKAGWWGEHHSLGGCSPVKADTSPNFQKHLEWEYWAASSGVLDVITLGSLCWAVGSLVLPETFKLVQIHPPHRIMTPGSAV